MTRSGKLLTVIAVAALAGLPSASLAQQPGARRISPGGPIIPSVRVLPGELPDLIILNMSASAYVKCIQPFRGQTTITVAVRNVGKVAAVMPPTMPQLGRYWVGVWDLNIFPGVMSIAAGPPPKLDSGETRQFAIPMIVNLSPSGAAYAVRARVDPQNLIFEKNEGNNEDARFFSSNSVCK
jgi:subtilase family serine protease